MAKSHAELHEMLDALDQFIPGLVQSKPEPDDFWATLKGLADAVRENAAPEDQGWVGERLEAILKKHQLVPPADQI